MLHTDEADSHSCALLLIVSWHVSHALHRRICNTEENVAAVGCARTLDQVPRFAVDQFRSRYSLSVLGIVCAASFLMKKGEFSVPKNVNW